MSSVRNPLPGLLLLFALAGCVSVEGTGTDPGGDGVELVDTPFFPQQAYRCGPAALATLLTQSGLPVEPDRLAPEVYLPGRRGSLQLELMAASRRHGRIPYPVASSLEALSDELRAGRPVLVLQNLGLEKLPVWHYAVVIGIDPVAGRVILRSGRRRRVRMPTGRFLKTWRGGGGWGMVLLAPGELPANLDPERYTRAVAGMEAIAGASLVEAAYRAAVRRWPGYPAALFGLAHSQQRQHAYREAARNYRKLLTRLPGDPVVLNNLADTLRQAGCFGAARAMLEEAFRGRPLDPQIRKMLLQTQAEVVADMQKPGAAGECRILPPVR